MTGSRAPRPAWRALLVGVALGLAASWAPVAPARGLGDELKKLVKQQPSGKGGQQFGFVESDAREDGPLSLDQAVAKVRKLHPKGEIVGAETRDGDRGRVHVVKVLGRNGKLKVYRFDAATGAKLG